MAKLPYNVTHVATGEEALDIINSQAPNAVLLDLELPDMNGREILEHIHEQAIPTAVIVITAHGSVDVAVDVMRAGAVDFLEKPLDQNRVLVCLSNALRQRQLAFENTALRRQLSDSWELVGRSAPMQELYQALERADRVDDAAAAIGAANTVECVDDGDWRASNADAPAVRVALACM